MRIQREDGYNCFVVLNEVGGHVIEFNWATWDVRANVTAHFGLKDGRLRSLAHSAASLHSL